MGMVFNQLGGNEAQNALFDIIDAQGPTFLEKGEAMKINKSQLRQIIKEEIEGALAEEPQSAYEIFEPLMTEFNRGSKAKLDLPYVAHLQGSRVGKAYVYITSSNSDDMVIARFYSPESFQEAMRAASLRVSEILSRSRRAGRIRMEEYLAEQYIGEIYRHTDELRGRPGDVGLGPSEVSETLNENREEIAQIARDLLSGEINEADAIMFLVEMGQERAWAQNWVTTVKNNPGMFSEGHYH